MSRRGKPSWTRREIEAIRSKAVLDLSDGKLNFEEIARKYGVAPYSVSRWAVRYKQSGNLGLLPAGRKKSPLRRAVEAAIAADPDALPSEIRARIGMTCTNDAIYSAVKAVRGRQALARRRASSA